MQVARIPRDGPELRGLTGQVRRPPDGAGRCPGRGAPLAGRRALRGLDGLHRWPSGVHPGRVEFIPGADGVRPGPGNPLLTTKFTVGPGGKLQNKLHFARGVRPGVHYPAAPISSAIRVKLAITGISAEEGFQLHLFLAPAADRVRRRQEDAGRSWNFGCSGRLSCGRLGSNVILGRPGCDASWPSSCSRRAL